MSCPDCNIQKVWEVKLRERLATLEAQFKASEKALTLSEGKVSRATLLSVLTVMLSIIAIAINVLKR